MKNLFLISIATMMLVACNGNKAKSANSEIPSDSVSVAENAVQTNNAKTFVLTEEGVGSLKMMQPFKDMSKSDEGLYNKVKKESYVDESSGMTVYDYTLYWDEERVAGFSLNGAKAPIVMLHIYSPRISMANGVRTGMSMRDFMKLEGAKAEGGEAMDWNYGVSISIGKIHAFGWWMGEGGDILTEQGKSKAGSASLGESAKLIPEDILPDVTVTDLCVYRKDE